jgi:hypothetical protein
MIFSDFWISCHHYDTELILLLLHLLNFLLRLFSLLGLLSVSDEYSTSLCEDRCISPATFYLLNLIVHLELRNRNVLTWSILVTNPIWILFETGIPSWPKSFFPHPYSEYYFHVRLDARLISVVNFIWRSSLVSPRVSFIKFLFIAIFANSLPSHSL